MFIFRPYTSLILSLFVCLLATGAVLASPQNVIQLRSDMVNGRLVPAIIINNEQVIRVQDRGNKDMFESTFDRAESIYATLVDLEEKGQDLSKIRVRRFKSEYTGHIKRIRVFTVTKGDILANEQTAYEIARSWVKNIRDSVRPEPLPNSDGGESILLAGQVVNIASIVEDSKPLFPLAFLMTYFTEKGFGFFLFMLVFFSLMQLGIAYAVFYYSMRRHDSKQRALHSRLDKLQNSVSTLRKQSNEVNKELRGLKRSSKLSNPLDVLKKLEAS